MTVDVPEKVLFITIDSLRPDYLGRNGHHPSPSPFLDQLFDQGLEMRSCFSVGAPTQFALPGLLSSTLPLDHGGYDFGVRDRPVTLAEAFSGKGYDTAGFVTGFWMGRLFDYDRGFDVFEELYSPDTMVRAFQKVYIEFSRRYVETEDATLSEVVDVLRPLVSEFFDAVLAYCRGARNSASRTRIDYRYPSSRHHGWDFQAIERTVESARRTFRADEEQFVRSLLTDGADGDFLEELLATQTRPPNPSLPAHRRVLLGSVLTGTGLYPFFRPWLGTIGTRATAEKAYEWLTDSYAGGVSSAAFVLEKARRWLTRTDGPTFSWVHLNDIHSGNLFSWERGASPRRSAEFDMHLAHLKRIATSGPDYQGSPRYDLAIRYIDDALGRTVRALRRDLSEPPLIVITADHGVPVLPPRTGDWVAQFFDELLHVPVGIVHPSIDSRQVDALCSTVDLGPILFELLGFEVPSGFRGRSLSDLIHRRRREYVVAEDLARGPCAPELKPLNVCVRTSSRKLTCSRWASGADQLQVRSAFDLESDPREQRDLSTGQLPAEFERLRTITADRLQTAADGLR